MPIKIFHSKNARHFEKPYAEFPSDSFELVAEVDTDDLQRAYDLTVYDAGIGDGDWMVNEGVTLKIDRGYQRGTGVGDVLVDAEGKQHRVLILGFGPV